MIPYSDENMRWDENSYMYYLTEKATEAHGLNLRYRISAAKGDATVMIQSFLEDVSMLIYGFIHEFNIDNRFQDGLIASTQELRDIIYRALIAQTMYMVENGDLSISTKDEDLSKIIAPKAKMILNTTVRRLGTSILYTGVW